MLKKMRIKKRLTSSFVIVTGITSFVAVLGCVAMIIMSSRYDYALENYGFPQGEIGKAMSSFAETRSSTRAAIGYTDAEIISNVIERHDAKKQAFDEYIANIEGTCTSEEERQAYEAATVHLEEYWKVDAEVIEIGNTIDVELSAQAQKLAADKLDPLFNEVYDNLATLMDVNVTKANELSSTLNTLKTVLTVVILAVIVAAMIIAIKLGDVIAKGIATPLNSLANRLKAFAAGDLGSEFPIIDSKDEVFDMISEARGMAENLKLIISDAGYLLGEMAGGNYAIKTSMEDKYVGDFSALIAAMRKMNQQMNETLHQIEDASDQVTAGSGNLAEAAQSMAEGATDQAGSVEELQATIASLTDGIRKTAESVDESYRQAKKYAEEADRSKGEMEAMVSAMERINDTSQKIENIISEIEDIASQTNLLSLNAAIEAARAGEAGKGFAVVADQIGKLAEQSAKSAIDTRELIEGSIQEISEGNKAAERAAASIGEVVNGVKKIADDSKKLSDISLEQANAMGQAELGVEQISEVVQSNSATAEEISATSEELSAQAESMSILVNQFVLADSK